MEGAVLSRVVSRNDDAVLRVLCKAMTGIYPVQVYIHCIGVAKSLQCPHCSNKANETLTHFACVCPAFLEAWTANHNLLRAVFVICLKDILSEDWDVFEETPLASTGLKLQQVLIEDVQLLHQALRDTDDNNEKDLENADLGRWQQDLILIS